MFLVLTENNGEASMHLTVAMFVFQEVEATGSDENTNFGEGRSANIPGEKKSILDNIAMLRIQHTQTYLRNAIFANTMLNRAFAPPRSKCSIFHNVFKTIQKSN